MKGAVEIVKSHFKQRIEMTGDSESDCRKKSRLTESEGGASLPSPGDRQGEPGQHPTFTRRAEKASRSTGRASRRRSFVPIERVLDQVVDRLGLDRRLKEHTLLSLWPVLVGEPFASRSRALFLDFEGNVVVAVKDSSVGQELSLNRSEMLRKLNFAAKSMGLKVAGLRFDLKRYHEKNDPDFLAQRGEGTGPRREPSPDELTTVALTVGDRAQVEELNEQLRSDGHSDEILINRILSMFEQELKLKAWRESQGFPRCSKCRLAVQALHTEERLCSDCYFERQSTEGKLGKPGSPGSPR